MVFIESICNDEVLVKRNIVAQQTSPEYEEKSEGEVERDVRSRIELYKRIYQVCFFVDSPIVVVVFVGVVVVAAPALAAVGNSMCSLVMTMSCSCPVLVGHHPATLLSCLVSCWRAPPSPPPPQPLDAEEGHSFIKLIDAGNQASARSISARFLRAYDTRVGAGSFVALLGLDFFLSFFFLLYLSRL